MASKTILFIGLIVLIVICAAFTFYFKTKKENQRIEELKNQKTWYEKRHEFQLNNYNNLIAFWINEFEERTEVLKKRLKVDTSTTESMFTEYQKLNGSTGHGLFINKQFDRVIPFVGEDQIFYAICFSKNDSFGEYEINLIAYAKDKFLNKLVEPVEFDTLYVPVDFVDDNWLIKPYYLDAEAIYE